MHWSANSAMLMVLCANPCNRGRTYIRSPVDPPCMVVSWVDVVAWVWVSITVLLCLGELQIGRSSPRPTGDRTIERRQSPVMPVSSSRPRARLPRAVVRRPQVGKLGEQIVVRAYSIPPHFPIRDDRQEGIGGVVAGCAAIVRVGRRARGVIVQQVRQQCPCHPPGFHRRKPPEMLERMREGADETGIVSRLRGAIRFVLLAGQEGSLGGSRTALRLHPAPVHPTQRASPQAHQVQPQNRVGHFQRDATYVFICVEILANELKVVKGTRVEEKGIAAPARKEAIVAGLRHLGLPPHRDRRSLDDHLPT